MLTFSLQKAHSNDGPKTKVSSAKFFSALQHTQDNATAEKASNAAEKRDKKKAPTGSSVRL